MSETLKLLQIAKHTRGAEPNFGPLFKIGDNMKSDNKTLAVFSTHDQAELAIKKLGAADFDMKKLSIIGQDYHTEEHAVGFYNMGDRVKHWGKLGAWWGGIWGLVFGAGLFAIPGLGAILVGGPILAAIVATAEGAVVTGGVTALGAALMSVGIPKDSVMQYEQHIKAGKFIVIIHGSAKEVERAHSLLESTFAESCEAHPPEEVLA